ncbi:MAG: helix-turn-helix domain-containing protein [Christensenellales bacterium]|jgi:two-component system response regulator YesN
MFKPGRLGKPFYIAFLTYLCMLAVPAMLSLMALRGTGHGIIASIEKSNNAVAERYGVNVETQLQQITLLSYELYNSPALKTLSTADEFNPQQRISIYQLLNKNSALLAQHPLVYDFYIYFGSSDTVLSSTGTHSGFWYHSDNIANNGPDYQSWKSLMTAKYAKTTYLPGDSGLVSPAEAEKYILCARSLANGGDPAKAATIIIKIPKEVIKDKCLSSNYSADGVASIFYDNGELVASAANNTFAHFDEALSAFVPDDPSTLLSVSEIPSMSAFLVYALPDSAYTSQLWNAYTHMKESLILISVAALTLASVFSYLVYRPLDKLALWIYQKNQKDQIVGGNKDSYRFIRYSFDQLFAKHEQTALELYRIKASMGEEYLLRLLEGRQPVSESLLEKLEDFNLEFPHPIVWVILCQDKDRALDRPASWESFVNMVYRSIPCESLLYRVNVNEKRQALLLCCEKAVDEASCRVFQDRIRNWIERQNAASLRVALGGQAGLEDLHDSYRLAKRSLDSFFLHPEATVLDSKTLCETADKYSYAAEKENLLMQHVVRRDKEQALSLLDELFDENISRKKLSLEMTRLFLYALLDTAFKMESALSISPSGFSQNPMEMIKSCPNINDARTQIKFVYSLLCDPSRDGGSMAASASWRVHRIVEYIGEHYLDSSLSLFSVAEHFKITPQYLSSIFKKTMNENFSAYIQKLRLEHSLTLMPKNKLTLNVIAERSGFNNYIALSRAFQKYFGITPGAYRQSLGFDCEIALEAKSPMSE